MGDYSNFYNDIFRSNVVKNMFDDESVHLPQLPQDQLKWIQEARPYVEGKERLILPFWRDIYNDTCNNKMIMGGRQIFKSTYTTDVLACESTSQSNVQLIYVTYDDANKSGFSRQKLQIGTFATNPVLAQFPRYGMGSVGEISLRNGSTIYIVTDHGQYHHVEGKSAVHVMLDEAQYQDMQYFERVLHTMTMTQGKISVLGIGGESGSSYEALWLQTDQREWEYDDPYWRDKLQFKNINGRMQLVVEDYLMDVCRGRWIAKNPNSKYWHGYHIPQTIMPQIPLTESDAIYKYGTDPIYSLEYKRKHTSSAEWASHVMGEFFKADRRPITREMIESCMSPYNYLRILSPADVYDIKYTWGEKVKVAMGVDFGSGKTSKTVIAVLIKWLIREETNTQKSLDRYQLAFLEPRPQENQLAQAKYIRDLFNQCNCDIGVGDLGYGAIQVQQIQDGGGNEKGETYEGVGSNKFYGCRTTSDETKPLMEFKKKIDEHGEQRESLTIDKTQAIQGFVNFLQEIAPHPTHPTNTEMERKRLMIPNHPDIRDQIDFIYNDWTSLTRKDLPEEVDNQDADPRQKAKREFNHPSDSLMAMIYAIEALKIKQYWNYVGI